MLEGIVSQQFTNLLFLHTRDIFSLWFKLSFFLFCAIELARQKHLPILLDYANTISCLKPLRVHFRWCYSKSTSMVVVSNIREQYRVIRRLKSYHDFWQFIEYNSAVAIVFISNAALIIIISIHVLLVCVYDGPNVIYIFKFFLPIYIVLVVKCFADVGLGKTHYTLCTLIVLKG